MNKKLLILLMCMVMLVLAACATSNGQQEVELTGKVWVLTELLGNPPVAGTGISALFSTDGKVGGSAGCNRYNGAYTVSGDQITFSSPMATTMMMCEQAAMDQESAYLQVMGEAKTFTVKADQLTLSDGEGTKLVVYQAQSQDLASTGWEATMYNNGNQAVVGVLEGTILTADFMEDGSISGNSGCNNFTGGYKVEGDQITIGPLASTMMNCSDPEGIMDQEANYLKTLQSAASYQVEGNVLELRTKDGELSVLFNKK
jgi:heat shock protein HslJ